MARLFLLLVVLPCLSVPAAYGEHYASRQHYQLLLDEAYQRYPAIPAGLLEAQAWVATRWQHRIPETGESHHLMPPAHGLFGLYGTSEHGFVDLLGEVAQFNGTSRHALLADVRTYVLATSAWLEEQIVSFGLEGEPIEAFRPIVERLSGIAATTELARFAVASHAWELYRTAAQGLDYEGAKLEAQSIDLHKVFSDVELAQVGAARVVVTMASKPGEDSGDDSAAPAQVNVDYPGAIWSEAANWSSRDGDTITHVVVHTMQGSYAGSINWFLNPDSNVSSHYLMRSSDGQITQMVRDRDKAWHARSANSYSLGIEHEGWVDDPTWYTDTMYEESARLTAYFCNAHPVDCSKAYDGPSHDTVVELSSDYTIKGHQHYPDQSHSDPGINWDWPRYHALVNGGVIPPDVNSLPAASFTVECTGLACSFDATASSDSDGAISGYSWDFGDATTGDQVTATHTYAAGGSFDVKLSVTDDKTAVHELTQSVAVTSPPPPPPAKKSGGGAASLWVLLPLLLLAGCGRGPATTAGSEPREQVPEAAPVPDERSELQRLIDEAYARHPGIPAGLLESQGWVTTRLKHRVPDSEPAHHGMPQAWGLFGLYGTSEQGFADLLGQVAESRRLSKDALLADQETYVFATADWIERQLADRNLAGQPVEKLRPVIEVLSGFSLASATNRVAVNSHVYEVYRTLGVGIESASVSIPPQPVDLRQVFGEDELRQLGVTEDIISEIANVPRENE